MPMHLKITASYLEKFLLFMFTAADYVY